VEATDGLETILSFLRDEEFIKNNLNSGMIIFGKNRMRIIKFLIANLTALSKNMDDLRFVNKCNDLNLVGVIFSNIIENSDISSDVIFSSYLFLSTICNESQIENEFKSIPRKFKTYLRTCYIVISNNQRETVIKIRLFFFFFKVERYSENENFNHDRFLKK